MFIANEIITETERFINEFENGMNKVCIYLEKAGREFNVEMKANLLSVVCEAEGSTTVDQKESDLEEKDVAVKTKLAERIKNAIKVAIEFIIKFKEKVMNTIKEKFQNKIDEAKMKKIKQILVENSAIGKTDVEVPVKLLSATEMMKLLVRAQEQLFGYSSGTIAEIAVVEDEFNDIKNKLEKLTGTQELSISNLFDLYTKFIDNNKLFEHLCSVDYLKEFEKQGNTSIDILTKVNSLNKLIITEGSKIYIETLTGLRSILISEVGKLAGKEEPVKESVDEEPADIDGVVDELLEPTDPDEIDPDVSKEIDDIIDDILDDEDDDEEPDDDTDDDEEIPNYDGMTDDEFYESLRTSI